jgi:hypothetical protein
VLVANRVAVLFSGSVAFGAARHPIRRSIDALGMSPVSRGASLTSGKPLVFGLPCLDSVQMFFSLRAGALSIRR